MPVEIRVWHRTETNEVCIQVTDKTTGYTINAWMPLEDFKNMIATILPKEAPHHSVIVH
jgi:hypothetical protein